MCMFTEGTYKGFSKEFQQFTLSTQTRGFHLFLTLANIWHILFHLPFWYVGSGFNFNCIMNFNVKHLFRCLLNIWIYSFVKYVKFKKKSLLVLIRKYSKLAGYKQYKIVNCFSTHQQ